MRSSLYASIGTHLSLLDEALPPISADYRISPTLRDIALSMPEAREALSTPSHMTASFANVIKALPAFTEKWRADARQQLADTIRRGFDKNTFAKHADVLALAVSAVFECDRCHHLETQDDALSHFCNPWPRPNSARGVTQDVYADIVAQELEYVPCQLNRSFADTFARRHACEIIKACGFAQTTTTAEDMDASDVRLVCRQCTQMNKGVTAILTWRAAVSPPSWVLSSS